MKKQIEMKWFKLPESFLNKRKIWKNKKGEKFTTREFLRLWKKGIVGMTPFQAARSNHYGFYTVFIGLFWGLIFGYLSKTWWLVVTLLGSSILVTVQFIQNYQNLKAHKDIENKITEAEMFIEKEMEGGQEDGY